MAKSSRDIEVSTFTDDETRVFLSANSTFGEEILNRISNGDEYVITKVTGIIPGVGKSAKSTVVIERKRTRIEDDEVEYKP